jgi:hypothetical protein
MIRNYLIANNAIKYLEGYSDGCWMNALTMLCMASV